MHDPTPIVLTQGTRTLDAALAELTASMASREWLQDGGPRVFLRVARRHRSPLVERTAAAVAADLARRLGRDAVAWVDDAVPAAAALGLPVASWGAGEAVPVAACGVAGAIRVPAAWFEPGRLVTITGAGRDPHARVWGALEAQAEPLVEWNPHLTRAAIAFEARRLGASELAIVCGTGVADMGDGGWWIAGPDDATVDAVLARAAGMRPQDLPRLRALGRHERDARFAAGDPGGTRVRLRPASAAGAAIAAAWDAARQASVYVAADAAAFRRNLPKIPFFLRRYLRMFFPART